MVDWLWVPEIQRLEARNWNLASSRCALTASRVAKSVGVSTPLRGVGVGFRVIFLLLFGFSRLVRGCQLFDLGER